MLLADGKPIRKASDLEGIARTAAGKKVKAILIRQGKQQTVDLAIEPLKVYSLKFTATNYAQGGDRAYYIGVHVIPVNRTLRSHLRLTEGNGVVVNDVVKESPAAKAGVLKHDVLLQVGEKPLSKLSDLREAVKASAGKSLSIKLMRSGKQQILNVTPQKRPLADSDYSFYLGYPTVTDRTVKYWDLRDGRAYKHTVILGHPAVATPSKNDRLQTKREGTRTVTRRTTSTAKQPSQKDGLEAKLNQMMKQLEHLQQSVTQLQKSLSGK